MTRVIWPEDGKYGECRAGVAIMAAMAIAPYRCDLMFRLRVSQDTLKRHGITLDRSTLSTWVGRACWWLKPLYELVVSDATPIRIVIRHC